MLDNASILVTGGTGSWGQKFIDYVLMTYKIRKIVVYSRNEPNQVEMESRLGYFKEKLRFIVGSVTDYDRLYSACNGIDFVFHAAALKVVHKAEYNPAEYMKVNILGTQNVIDACLERKVKRAVFLSTDKGVMPVNFYGFTKGTAERLWMESNYRNPIFSVVRYGNVMGSRGSVINDYLKLRDQGAKDYPITDMECTRFWVDFKEAIDLALAAIEEKPGVTLVSKTRPFKIRDLAKAAYLRSELKVIGLREGEKIHETLITEYEAARTKEMHTHYRIFPASPYDDLILYDKEKGDNLTKAVTSNDGVMNLEEVREKLKAFEEGQRS